jgi:hypothetical protein
MLENVDLGITPFGNEVCLFRYGKKDKDNRVKLALEKRVLTQAEVASFLFNFFKINEKITFPESGDVIAFFTKEEYEELNKICKGTEVKL